MSGEGDLIQKARARFLKEAAERASAQAAEEFDRQVAQLRQFAEQHPDVAAAVLKAHSAPTAMTSAPVPEHRPMAEANAPDAAQADETVNDLIQGYTTDPLSTYRKIRPRTRSNYDSLFRIIKKDIGNVRVAALDTAFVWSKYQEWTKRGQTMGHSMVGAVRILASYGAKVRKSRVCRELKMTINEMRFPANPRSSERQALTREQVNKIRAKAHEKGLHSIALAQAIQFETGLRQTDCLGEWVLIKEGGASEVVFDGMKWVRGLRWSSIDQNLMLRHTRSQTQKEFVFDLRKAPMVMEELTLLGDRPTSGEPMIVYEHRKRPYRPHQFRRRWREIADAVGIPNFVKNMDSRPDNDERPQPHRQTRKGQRL